LIRKCAKIETPEIILVFKGVEENETGTRCMATQGQAVNMHRKQRRNYANRSGVVLMPDQSQDEDRSGKGWHVKVEGAK